MTGNFCSVNKQSRSVILLLFIHCFLLLPMYVCGVCAGSLVCGCGLISILVSQLSC